MTRKERIDAALNFQEPDRPPHFEQLFQIPEEAFSLSFPDNEAFVEADPKRLEELFAHTAHIYAKIIETYHWDAVIVFPPVVGWPYENSNHPAYQFIPYLKKFLLDYFGEEVPVGAFLWRGVISIDIVNDFMASSVQLAEEREKVVEWADELCEQGLRYIDRLLDMGVDFIDIASDHAFNSGTFLSPRDFADLVTPYNKRLVDRIHAGGAWVIMHSDGNLMNILDQILEAGPDVLQSIDPLAGMDIAEVKKRTYGKIALMGNVNCSYLQIGPKEKIIESSQYCLEHATAGGGYIFSSSNTIFDGVPLENYMTMLNCLHTKYSKTY